MAKDTPANRQQMRNQIAHLAARLIAQDGISDYGLAKRKAARQAGAPDSRNLPTNLEIEEALRIYHQLYQADEHPVRLHALRALALDTMRTLSAFSPHLTGSVLSGSIGRHADVHLHLYTDNPKGLEMFLANERIDFRVRDSRVWIGDLALVVPCLIVSSAAADIHLTVLSPGQRRAPFRLSPDGRALERATIEQVETLVEQE